MAITHESPAEELSTDASRRPRTASKWIAGLTGLVVVLGASGACSSGNKEGRPSATQTQPGGTGEGRGGGTETGMPDNIREVVDLPAFRDLAAKVLDVPEDSITSSSGRILSTSDTNGNGSVFLFNTDGSLGLSLSHRPRISQVGALKSDSLTAHKKTVSRNPANYEEVKNIKGAEAAYYDKSTGKIDVFGSDTDNFQISVQLSARDSKVPIDRGGHLGAGPGAMEATSEVAKAVVQEYFVR